MRTPRLVLAATAASALGLGLPAAAVAAQPAPPSTTVAAPAADTHAAAIAARSGRRVTDSIADPLETKRTALRSKAIEGVLDGTLKAQHLNGSVVAKVADAPAPPAASRHLEGAPTHAVDQYVELSRETTDKIFVILVEFGNQRHPDYPDKNINAATPGPSVFDGPLHNSIPAPDRSKDNTTIWQANYDRQAFQGLYFGDKESSVKSYYEKQSSGRYSVDGEVTDWVKVPYNEARYGRSTDIDKTDPVVCADVVCNNSAQLVVDGIDTWVAGRKAAGTTDAQLKAELASFDQWDRYDYDGDGNFNEPDGYIDHFQIVHAGADEAAGGGQQGEDAIWSHKSYVNSGAIGQTGPTDNPFGGTQVGDTGLWVGNYTMQPENGGLGVFAHEYGHDLGLPDEYDTTYKGESSAAFWTLMSSGSYLNEGKQDIGSLPGDMNAWDKLQLGWLDYDISRAGTASTHKLGPAEYNSDKPQALITVLPPKSVSFDYGAPYAGSGEWWSTSGDELDTRLTTTVDLSGTTAPVLAAKVRYDIEEGYDYLYVEASSDDGATWTRLDGTVAGKPFTDDGTDPALTGTTGGQWLDLSVPLTAYAGKAGVRLRFHYRTDAGVAPAGFFADDITIADGATVISTNGAEAGDTGWVADGFETTTGSTTKDFAHYYIAENRQYVSYDRTLETGPYSWQDPAPTHVYADRFPYQDGLLISYWDTSQSNNDVGEHPGQGLILPIDAHPAPMIWPDGSVVRTRTSVYDATFGTERVDSFPLTDLVHSFGKPWWVKHQKEVRTFDDAGTYWYAAQPDAGVKVPATGTSITVTRQRGTSITVDVTPTATP